MVLSISLCLVSEVSLPDFARISSIWSREMHTCVFQPEGVRDTGTEYSGRSHSLDCDDPSETIDIRLHGYRERTNCDSSIQEVLDIEKKAVLGQSLLGSWLLCRYSGSGRREDSSICSIARTQRETWRAMWTLRIIKNLTLRDMGRVCLLWGHTTAPLWGALARPRPLGVAVYL